MKAEAEEWIKTKLAKQYLKDCHVNPYDLPKILSDFAELSTTNLNASQSPEPNTVTEKEMDLTVINKAIEDFKASDKWDHVDWNEEEGFPIGFECGANWALQQTQAVTEPYHKEAIELVKKHIPNNALAKEYILEWLQQTQAVGVSIQDIRTILQNEFNQPVNMTDLAWSIHLDKNAKTIFKLFN